ncbi:unnamed protein product [Rotaria magnacalcarata]|nr:unnamed protein product [Rotaria magnacalcarata]
MGGFTCECLPSFTGLRCEDQDGCSTQPCKNRGVCANLAGGSYECQCRTGFEGPTCEQMDICGVKNPCICGTCQNDPYSPQGFRCFCPAGYSGNRCEKFLNCLDAGEECMNGGTCMQRPLGDYVCSCPYPYCGLRCQSQRPSCGIIHTLAPTTTPSNGVSLCSASQCNNHGICHEASYGKGIQCYCSTGWSGSRCQYSLSCKDIHQCRNGGVCRELTEDISICHCSAQFWGERCEYAYESWSGTGFHEQQQQHTSNQYNHIDPSATNLVKKSVSNKTKKRKQTNKI